MKDKAKQKFNTKYKIGDKLYYFEDNQVQCSTVNRIEITIYTDKQYGELYYFTFHHPYKETRKNAKDLFKSKEALIKNLSQ